MNSRLAPILKAALLTVAAALGTAFAQHPLLGTYLEQQIGFVVAFELAPDGQLAGTLHGAGAPLPLTIQADQQAASGWFVLENQMTGFSAQLQQDGTTLLVWLYALDANGQPVPGTEEQYTALRQQVTLPDVPRAPADDAPPAVNQPPMVTKPPTVITPPATSQPPDIGGPNVTAPPVTAPPIGGPQTGAQQPADARQLVGTWQGVLQLQDVALTLVMTFNADGTYREEGYVDGTETAWYSGSWNMTDGGQLHQTATQFSPQFCVRGQCSPNEISGTTTATVQFTGPDSLVITQQAEAGQQPLQLNLQRTASDR